MKIALLGYGKMGRFIEGLALAAGDEIVLRVDEANRASVRAQDLAAADVAIEFSRPEAAVGNIDLALAAGVPIVVGTTGWLAQLPEVTARVQDADGALFWASNFSVGVNVFFAAARRTAELLNHYGTYQVSIEETHHLQKLDAPSGTAITLAETVASALDAYAGWELKEVKSAVPQTQIAGPASTATPVPIVSIRQDGVPGTHHLAFSSDVDTLELRHTAHSRAGFAEGALVAARWMVGRRGVFSMPDLLNL